MVEWRQMEVVAMKEQQAEITPITKEQEGSLGDGWVPFLPCADEFTRYTYKNSLNCKL